MSDLSDLVAAMARLSDAELAEAVAAATEHRHLLASLHAVASASAQTAGHAAPNPDVSPAPVAPSVDLTPAGPSTSEEVVVVPTPAAIPVPPTDMPTPAELGGYTAGGVPTFESIRDKVEQRFGTAAGMGELDRQTPAGRSTEEQWQAREKAARERLEQIRRSVHGSDTD